MRRALPLANRGRETPGLNATKVVTGMIRKLWEVLWSFSCRGPSAKARLCCLTQGKAPGSSRGQTTRSAETAAATKAHKLVVWHFMAPSERSKAPQQSSRNESEANHVEAETEAAVRGGSK
jgi:hypothetical protein